MKVVVVGGGAAGMMAAIASAKEQNEVILIEKNSSLGNKLKITGKGRCNLTFDGQIDELKQNLVKNEKFMYRSFYHFNNQDVRNYFESIGVKTKVERGGRVFPVSDRAQDVVLALEKELERYHVTVWYRTVLQDLKVEDGMVVGVKLQDGKVVPCDKCILATGGLSYPSTGSTGDGYVVARKYGHKVIPLLPGLVPLTSSDPICKKLQGLSLKNVTLTVKEKTGKKIYEGFGEMMFSHFGVTGPLVLSASSRLNRYEKVQEKIKKGEILACIDFKPALTVEMLDKRICRDFAAYSNKDFQNSLEELLPRKLIPVVVLLSGIDKNKKVHQITKEERSNLVKMIKNFTISLSGFMPIDIAIITSGGIDVKEVNPKTMESKLVKGLYFAGEILDVDAYTGGFNLQIAFSTGVAAGKNKEVKEEK